MEVSASKDITCPGDTLTITYVITNVSDQELAIFWYGDNTHQVNVYDNVEDLPIGGTFRGTFSYSVSEQDGIDGRAEFAMYFRFMLSDYTGDFEGNGYCSVPVVPRVEFVNYDGTVLQMGAVAAGQTPVYGGATPTRPKDPQYEYVFAGWEPEVVAVEGGLDSDSFRLRSYRYTATYDEVLRSYTVEFVNYDGTQLQSSEVPYGETPKYDGDEPARPEDAQCTYIFAGWSPEIVAVTGEATYTATFTEIAKATLTFDLGGGTLDGQTGTITIEANVGDTINLPGAPTRPGYTFVCWVGSEYEAGAEYVVPEGGHTFTAKWQKVIPETGDGAGGLLAAASLVAAASLAVLIVCAPRRRRRNTGDAE